MEVALAAHATHAVAPVVLTYLPASHSSHRAAADTFEYQPTWHGVQAGDVDGPFVILQRYGLLTWHK